MHIMFLFCNVRRRLNSNARTRSLDTEENIGFVNLAYQQPRNLPDDKPQMKVKVWPQAIQQLDAGFRKSHIDPGVHVKHRIMQTADLIISTQTFCVSVVSLALSQTYRLQSTSFLGATFIIIIIIIIFIIIIIIIIIITIAGFHMTSLKFELQNYWSSWYFT